MSNSSAQLMYRIFHPTTARGVYSHRSYCSEKGLDVPEGFSEFYMEMLCRHDPDATNTPTIYTDVFLRGSLTAENSRDKIFGFTDALQFSRWFSPYEIKMLSHFGFKVAKMQVEVYGIFEHQMITSQGVFYNTEILEVFSLEDFK